MNETPGYGRSLFYAIGLHLILIGLLMTESSSSTPVFQKADPTRALSAPVASAPPQEIVKAVSVDNSEIQKKVQELKAEQARQKQQEVNRQQQLQKQAEQAKQARIQEQKKLQQLKQEAERVAIARKKKLEEEQKRLKELSEKQAKEEKRLAELKQKQEKLKKEQEQATKQAELKKKAQQQEEAKAQAKAEQKKAEEERRRQVALQAAKDDEERAQMSGEIDKYKALIINAISRRWILPDNADPSLSCQFHLRLAPDGSVLDVKLIRSSGDPVLDRSAQSAIYKASPLPVPSDPMVFDTFRDINLTVRPEQSRG